MKHKKRKPLKPIIHTKLPMTEEDQEAVMNALDFMTLCKSFPYEKAKIDPDCAHAALHKLSCYELTFTRGELRASAKAVEFAIQCLADRGTEFQEVAEAVPKLIPALEKSLPTLVRLNPDYQVLVADLKKLK